MGSLTLKQFQTPLLQPFDLYLEAGECIALSGQSGCGKSQLLRAIGDLDPHQGDAWIDEQNYHQMNGPQWRRQVGLLTAESTWWSDLVNDHFSEFDNDLLQQLGLPSDCSGWHTSRLSSGERQRLALIRLLQNQPKVLLLDEPTANLDPKNLQRTERLIANWRKQHDTAVLWVSHDESQRQRIADRQFHISSGQLERLQWS